MSSVSFVVGGLLVGVMIGVSLYGSRILPPDARIPRVSLQYLDIKLLFNWCAGRITFVAIRLF